MIFSVPPSFRELPLQFFPDTHTYYVDGREFSSVTRVLEATGIYVNPWARDHHRDRGTEVHHLCEMVDRGTFRESGSGLDGYAIAYQKFKEKYKVHVLANEKMLCSFRYPLAGKMDKYCILNINGDRCVLDIKSGKPSDAAWIQTALYQMMLEETSIYTSGKPWRVDSRIVLWLKKDGTYDENLIREAATRSYPADLNLGLSAVSVYNYRKSKGLL